MKSLTAMFKQMTHPKRDQKCLQAAFDGDFKTALDLIDQGANVNYTGTAMLRDTNHAAFMLAIRDIQRNGLGDTPIRTENGVITIPVPATLGHIAVDTQHPKALEAFLDKGMDPNISMDGKPLLMHALENDNRDAALILLARGAATTYVSGDLLTTPLSIALAKRFDDVVELIEKAQRPPEPAAPERVTVAAVTPMKPLILKKNNVSA